jgi:hypothetical protein
MRIVKLLLACALVTGIIATAVILPSSKPVAQEGTAFAEISHPTDSPSAKRERRAKHKSSRRSEQRSNYSASAPDRVVAAPASYVSSSPASKIALLIGIGHAPGSSELPGSKTDVYTVRDALIKYGFPAGNIQVLLEGQATRGAILGALDRLAARSMSSGTAVVSITTHSGHSSSGTSMRAWDGRVYAGELASRLGRVRGKLFTVLPTCYSGGYALPGVIGPNRIAVFSSSAEERSWQVGEAGSWVIRYMVLKGMIEGGAPTSVESAYNYSVRELKEDAPGRVPIIRDGIPGDLRLGPVTWLKPATQPKPAAAPAPTPKPANEYTPPSASDEPSTGEGLLGFFG